MDIINFNKKREVLNNQMAETDSFFELFGDLDTKVYADGVIPKKYKELTGLSISILTGVMNVYYIIFKAVLTQVQIKLK